MKKQYIAPNAGQLCVFLEKSIADTTVSMGGTIGGEIKKQDWEVDPGGSPADRGDVWLGL
jgi:hypothetical protein